MFAIGLLPLTLISFVINLPFGYFREGSRKFSVKWFLYIHLPIPFIIFLRLESGFSYKIIPILILAAVMGQLLGGISFKRLNGNKG